MTVSSDDNLAFANIVPYGVSWWNTNSVVTITNPTQDLPTGTDGIRWFCNGYKGTGNVSVGTSLTLSFTIDKESTCNFTWNIQYRLIVKNQQPGVGHPSPPEGINWFDAGSRLDFSVDERVPDQGSG